MRVVYSDESGVGSLKKEPLTVVTAIVLNADDQWESVEAALRVAEMGTPRNLLHNRQLKGSLLYSAVRKGLPLGSGKLKEILSIPAREKIGIFYGAVDRAGCLRALRGSSVTRLGRSTMPHFRIVSIASIRQPESLPPGSVSCGSRTRAINSVNQQPQDKTTSGIRSLQKYELN